MSYLLWHTIADMSGNWLAILDESKSDLWKSEFNNDYQMRTRQASVDLDLWSSLWARPRGMTGDSSAFLWLLGQDARSSAVYERNSVVEAGPSRPSFLIGRVLDPNGNVLASAVVDLYLTSTAALVATGSTDQNGFYMLPTPYAGQAHFVYANYANSTYVGGSANNLTPNF